MSADRTRTVAVVGQGYVGLPVAVRAVEAGFRVVGFDTDPCRIERLLTGDSYLEDISDEMLRSTLRSGRFEPTADAADLTGFDVAVVCVPTPLRDGSPDLRYVEDAAATLAVSVTPGCCVILESTSYPGTTEELFVPLLEAGSGLRAGRDFHVGFSPERIDPGNPSWNFRNTPKVVSGVSEGSLRAVEAFYAELVDSTVSVPSTREAELAKLLENTFRHVNIALVNELAMYCHETGIDVWSVVEAASTKPFGFMRFNPGPGVGGHCLPIDPSYLSWQVRRSLGRSFRFVEIANDVNDNMPGYVVSRITEHLNTRCLAVNGSRIVLLGMAYKRNSGDIRQSPAVAVARRLLGLGARLDVADPLIDPSGVPAGVRHVKCAEEVLRSADLIVVLADHDEFDWQLIEQHRGRVLDMCNALGGAAAERL